MGADKRQLLSSMTTPQAPWMDRTRSRLGSVGTTLSQSVRFGFAQDAHAARVCDDTEVHAAESTGRAPGRWGVVREREEPFSSTCQKGFRNLLLGNAPVHRLTSWTHIMDSHHGRLSIPRARNYPSCFDFAPGTPERMYERIQLVRRMLEPLVHRISHVCHIPRLADSYLWRVRFRIQTKLASGKLDELIKRPAW